MHAFVCSCLTGPVQAVQLSVKYIVYKECLAELFEECPMCCSGCDSNWHVIGSCVSITQMCTNCEYRRIWTSQPFVANVPAGMLETFLFLQPYTSLVGHFQRSRSSSQH